MENLQLIGKKKSAFVADSLNLKLRNRCLYTKFIWFNVVWLGEACIAKPQDCDVLLQAEKHAKPKIQIATNAPFFNVDFFML